jgi:carboxyl-terminal processing protease
MLYPDLKTVKDMLKKICVVLVLGAALACHASPAKPMKVVGSNDLQPDLRQNIVAKEVAGLISRYNYKKVDLNDSLSEIVYKRYLKKLDEDHNYLLASDVQDFDKFKDLLDDDMKSGNLNFTCSTFFKKDTSTVLNFPSHILMISLISPIMTRSPLIVKTCPG